MRGIPFFNHDAFGEWGVVLREAGWKVFSPAENDANLGTVPPEDGVTGGDEAWEMAAGLDLYQVARADAMFLLPDWEKSKGVALERHVADTLGKPVFRLPEVEIIPPFWDPNKLEPEVKYELAGRPSVPPPPPPSALDFGISWREESPEGTRKGRREAIFTTIPVYALVQEARVHGNSVVPKDGEEAKYADTEPGVPNWSHGAPWSWFLDALWRHLLAWEAGQSFDGESGLHQLAHVRWMAGWLMEMERLGKGTDDRRRQV